MTLGLVSRMDELERAPTSVISEASLVHGYSRTEREPAELCACGQMIVAASWSQADVEAAMKAHVPSTLHRLWSAWWHGGQG